MNKPVQEFLSVVLDATIIKPLIESVTGEDMITGEDLSEFEKGMKLASGGGEPVYAGAGRSHHQWREGSIPEHPGDHGEDGGDRYGDYRCDLWDE